MICWNCSFADDLGQILYHVAHSGYQATGFVIAPRLDLHAPFGCQGIPGGPAGCWRLQEDCC